MKLLFKSVLFIAAFGGALVLLVKQGSDHGALHLWELKLSDLESIQVVTATQNYQLSYRSEKWQIKQGSDVWETDAIRAKNWVQPLLHLHARSVLGGGEEEVSDYKGYGLEAPQSHIVINLRGSRQKELMIGHRSPLGDTYYVKLSNKPAVYLLSVQEIETFLDGKLDELKASVESSEAPNPH